MTSGEMKNSLAEYPQKESKKRGEAVGIEEFIAEAWSEYMNNLSPRPVAKKVAKELIELYKEAYLA